MIEIDSRRNLHPPFYVDGVLLTLTVILVGFSLVMVYSTTGVVCQEKFGDSLLFARKQAIAALVGLVLLFLMSRVRLNVLEKISPWGIVVSIALLLVTFVPGLATASGGAQRWIVIGGFNFQPAEFVKLFFVIFLAGYFSRQEGNLTTFSGGVIKPGAFLAAVSGLLLLQPDFGSSAILGFVTFGMCLAAGVRLRHIFIAGAAGALVAGMLVLMSPYRLTRVVSFLSPAADPSGSGYQLLQSLIAVGSGNLTGVGLGASQQKLFFLPAAHTDFIYAVIAEELGFIGAVVLLLVFFMFLWRGLHWAERMLEHTFAFSLTVGLTLLIVVPALVNVGVVIGILPTKGLVLPLVGSGGSSMIASLAAVGLLLALARSFYQDKIGLHGAGT